MADLNNPHDNFFKAVFSRAEVADDFLRHHLPADIAALIQPGSLEIGKDSFIEPELKEHYADLLYRVQTTTGQPGHDYLLFEHKSRPHPLIALDLLRYMVGIWGQAVKSGQGVPLPLILPIVLYHGRREWQIATDFGSLFDIPPGSAGSAAGARPAAWNRSVGGRR
jgi:predicted transposase/invertase (TIGR01784 family)